MIPVMFDAAAATPGQKETATSEAARKNLFPVTRMLGSFIYKAKTSYPSLLDVTQERF